MLAQIPAPGFFSGMQAGPEFKATLADLDQVFHEVPDLLQVPGAFYLGPRIDFAYLVYGVTPPLGVPLWWEYFNGSDPIGLETRKSFEDDAIKTIIVRTGDTSYLPSWIADDERGLYDAHVVGGLTVYRRKPGQ